MATICVPDIYDGNKVAAALQQAADAVLSDRMVDLMLTGPRCERFQVEYFFPSPRHSALGHVSLELPEPGKDTFVFGAVVFAKGHFEDALVVPPSVVSRLRVQIGDMRRAFLRQDMRRAFMVQLRFSAQDLRRHARARIYIK